MDRNSWVMLGCTAAIIATLIGCAHWVRAELIWDLGAIQSDLERSNR